MVFREGSWTAHLERFYLSVSVEKSVVELASVRNITVYITNIDHLHNTSQDLYAQSLNVFKSCLVKHGLKLFSL